MAWIEVGTDYFGLNSSFFTVTSDNRPLPPALLRVLARNANRMARQGGPLCNLVWDARAVSGNHQPGSWAIWPGRRWTPVVESMPVPHNPNCKTATLHVWAKIESGARAYFQTTTSVDSFSEYPTADRTLGMLGDGTMKHYSLSGIRLGTGIFETLGFYFRCDANNTQASVTDATGTVTDVGFGYFDDSASTQASVLGFPFFKYFVRFTDSSDGTQNLPLFRIEWKEALGGGGSRFQFTYDYFRFVSGVIEGWYDASGHYNPARPKNQERVDYYMNLINGSNYEILDPVDFQLGAVSLIEDSV